MVAVAGRLGDPPGFAAGAGRDRTFTAGGGQPRPTHAAPQTTQRMTRGPEATTGCGRASGRSITSPAGHTDPKGAAYARMVFSHRQVPIWHRLTEHKRRQFGEAEGVRDRAGQLSIIWPYKSKVSCICTDGVFGSTGTDLAYTHRGRAS